MKHTLQNASVWLNVFFLAILMGAAVYEMIVIAPEFCREIPNSMIAFAESNVEPGEFWRSPILVAVSLFPILALVFNWKTSRRKWLVYILVLVYTSILVTGLYFVPRLHIMGVITGKTTDDMALLSRAIQEWISGNYFRFGLLVVPAFFFSLKAVSIPLVHNK